MTVTRYGSLAVAVASAFTALKTSEDPGMSAAFFTVGLISFGCWLTLEVHALLKNPDRHIYDESEGGSGNDVDDGGGGRHLTTER